MSQSRGIGRASVKKLPGVVLVNVYLFVLLGLVLATTRDQSVPGPPILQPAWFWCVATAAYLAGAYVTWFHVRPGVQRLAQRQGGAQQVVTKVLIATSCFELPVLLAFADSLVSGQMSRYTFIAGTSIVFVLVLLMPPVRAMARLAP